MRTTTGLALLALAALTATAENQARADEGKKATPAAASSSDDASQRFKSGVAFYKDKDFTAALVEFKRAYELSPNYNVLFNLGQTARELKDHAAALTAFEQYLRDGGAKISAARRKEVAAAIDDLRRKVGKLKVVTSVDGAQIAVDDVPVGVSPLADPVVVNAGRRKLSATSSGYTPAQRVVDVAGLDETTVTLDLPRLDASPPQPAQPAQPKGPPLVAWVALSATAACGLAAGVTGGLALSAHGGLNAALAMFPGNAATITAAQGRTRTFAVTTDVLGAITVAGGVTSAMLFFVVPRISQKAAVAVTPTGIVVRGVF